MQPADLLYLLPLMVAFLIGFWSGERRNRSLQVEPDAAHPCQIYRRFNSET
jgi:hypothetical protein